MVTYSVALDAGFLTASANFPAGTGCAAVATCTGGAASPPPETSSTPPTASPGDSAGCTPSTLNYQCVVSVDGANLHYSIGTALPINEVTSSLTGRRRLAAAAAANDTANLVHFAIEATTKGYVAISFPAMAGRMSPSDSVIGWVDDTTGAAKVGTYHTTSHDVAASDANSGWATNLGVVQTTDGRTITVVSRSLSEPSASVARTLDPAALGINWAVGNRDGLGNHITQGGLVLNLNSGGSTTVSSNLHNLILAHGALMAVAWALLLPAGVLFARNKRKLGERHLGSKHAWFVVHVSLQLTGVVLMIIGFIIAVVKFDSTSDTPLGEAHKVLGIIVVAFAGAQVLASLARPAPDARHRVYWNHLHHNLGRLAVLASWATVYMGIVLMNNLGQGDQVPWIAAVTACLGVIIVAGIVLEVLGSGHRQHAPVQESKPASTDGKVQASSRYEPGQREVALTMPTSQSGAI